MGLTDHIEKIRQKPEHIRMRFVWFFVAISMIFILAVWFFSLKSGQDQDFSEQSNIDTTDILKQFDESKESIGEVQAELDNALKQDNFENN